MKRRLFEDLVISGRSTASSSSLRSLPLSLALHGMVVAILAAFFTGAVKEVVRPGPLVFHSSGPVHAAPPAGVPRPALRHAVRRTDTRPLLVDPTPTAVAVSDAPLAETDLGESEVPAGDSPICLGCAPGDAVGTPNGTGAGGPAGDPAPLRPVGGDVREPRRIRGTVPVYPELARRAHVQGKVVLECVIDTDGRITDIRVLSGPPLLTGAAVDAVRDWVYTPTTLNRQPIRVILNVTVNFSLGAH
jgi:periplasmic protein TonB